MPRVNLFIADSVGLGKTIEAGLILREMLMRQKVRRTVICCPPSVVRQWKDEMDQRFGLTFVIYDRDYVTAKRQERGYSVNPWTTHSRFIVSQALIRNETYAGALRDWLGEFQGGSLFILDEAHMPPLPAARSTPSETAGQHRRRRSPAGVRGHLPARPVAGQATSRDLLLPPVSGDRGQDARLPPRQVHRHRRPPDPHHLGQLHGGRPQAKHRGRHGHHGRPPRSGSEGAVRHARGPSRATARAGTPRAKLR